ncbi:MAG: SusC/RagA family TonB-linked outer membrane protein, partial [Ginsengibacter sp.]
MKLAILMLLTTTIHVKGEVFAQNISFLGKNVSIETIFASVESQTNYVFFYNAGVLKNVHPVSLDLKKVPVETLLKEAFKHQPITYYIKNHTIFITAKKEEPAIPVAPIAVVPENAPQEIIIKGQVKDVNGNPLGGTSVNVKGTKIGTLTDDEGRYTLEVKEESKVLVFSFVGMETQEIEIRGRQTINVSMSFTVNVSEGVVVTGYYAKSKSSFTGAAVTFTGAELKAVSPTNIFEALSTVTPGLLKVEEKAQGSNPNKVPEILVRGVTSFANDDQGVNQPLIVRDGTIISMQDLYDMDINEIETVTVLKDASAAALYGAKAANGVIVIERTKISGGKMRITYNATGSIQFPDFSDYKLLNAKDKLEYERLAGLYNSEDVTQIPRLDSLYNVRFKEVRRGVNTDWMAQPSRVGYSLDHSLRLSGGSDKTRFELNARYGSVEGVMKDDYRKRYGIGFALEYYAPNGVSFTNRTSFSRIDTKATPYGPFSQYTFVNPYDRIRDSFGVLNKVLSWDIDNPLYNASLGSYSVNNTQSFSNDFDARWVINDQFRVTSHWNIGVNNGFAEDYLSPLAGQFRNETDPLRKGSMVQINNKGLVYSGNLVGSYNNLFENNSLLSVNLGGIINRSDFRNSGFSGIGFYSDELRFMNFAASYPLGARPTGFQDLSTDVGSFLNLNYMYKDRYYLDGVYQVSGSSKFGVNNRYGHFWSTGAGWNIHNESFAQADWIDLLKLRGSVGYTGKINFASYQALTTYRFNKDLLYLNGIGAVPITIGNPDLKWERTMNYNAGLDLSFWKRRFNVSLDIYKRLTTDLLIDKTIAPSAGT